MVHSYEEGMYLTTILQMLNSELYNVKGLHIKSITEQRLEDLTSVHLDPTNSFHL